MFQIIFYWELEDEGFRDVSSGLRSKTVSASLGLDKFSFSEGSLGHLKSKGIVGRTPTNVPL